jgi:hypothetical protein
MTRGTEWKTAAAAISAAMRATSDRSRGGPATEVRIALIDPERGIVIGYAILYYGDSPRRMQINEVFKILNGRIRMVDNIGLMEEGITASGFTP